MSEVPLYKDCVASDLEDGSVVALDSRHVLVVLLQPLHHRLHQWRAYSGGLLALEAQVQTLLAIEA